MPKVLIVDDERGLLNLFSTAINRLNLDLTLADGGAAAIRLLGEKTFDLLILDLAMPEISGEDVLRYVRSVPHLSTMKVMILTARPNMIVEIEELGIDAWVPKPITPRDFLAVVQSLLYG